MREKVSASFADYALRIELDRLQEVGDAVQERYALQNNWEFLPVGDADKRIWISQELLRLSGKRQQKKHALAHDANSASPVDVAAPISPVEKPPSTQTMPAKAPIRTSTKIIVADEMDLPPLSPPVPPLPPLPPLPPAPPMPPLSPPMTAVASWFSAANATTDPSVSLFSRISILDKDQHYLAGSVLDGRPGVARPLLLDGEVFGYLRVTKTSLPSDIMAKDFLQEQADTILIIVFLSIALSALAASLLAWHFRRPIQTLVQGSRRLADGHFDTRLAVGRSDELGSLAQSFNQLADKLERAETSRRQWVADTSHELRTPISVLRAQLEAIQDGIRDASPEHIALMLRQVLSLNKLIDELYQLARADVGDLQYQMRSVALWNLVEEEAHNFKEKIAGAQLQLALSAETHNFFVVADPDRLRQVLINLLENAVRYTDAGGRISIRNISSEKNVCIVIEDSAPAVPEAALQRLSERFFRVDASRNRQQGGAGLGLALCARIVAAHGGEIVFSHSVLGGLCVTLSLPLEIL